MEGNLVQEAQGGQIEQDPEKHKGLHRTIEEKVGGF